MKTFYLLIPLFILLADELNAFPNCNLYKENEPCYQACLEAEKALKHFAGGVSFQKHFLKSISLCPEFSDSYFELSVPYAKRGLMHEWINLIDKAVEIDPEKHLGWRGWYHWFFMHNYNKAIADIDSLDSIIDYNIGETGDGLYHLNVLKGLCYKGLGDYQNAIEIIESTMRMEYYNQGSYDNLHLGVLYLKVGQPMKALILFEKQIEYNDISEAYYYSAKAYKTLDQKPKALEYLEAALSKYDARKAMSDPYRQLPDEIFRSDIEGLIKLYESSE